MLNQSIRDPAFSYATEFIPMCLADRPDLQTARAIEPWRWSGHNGHIRANTVRGCPYLLDDAFMTHDFEDWPVK
ncbi:hypothetical protein [Synechococcus sp. CBW1108]|uniref:hypothetical protein n=1 Tax=Synechococcus sp. CBW1108 TaxID=1353147 RepID=UPI0018CDE161|nr:hypothetical protein [Synechococcus sp. CBW1108]QPN70942.1 hypothetical protein H8F27_04775 [Synechococcus sp. CBW1108]